MRIGKPLLKPRGKYCSNHHEKDEFMNRLKISAFWFFLAVFQVIPVHGQTVEWKTFAGNYGAKGVKDGPAAQSRFYEPGGMAPDGSGGIYVTDIESDTIRRISSNGVVSTFVGSPGNNGSTDGPVEVARLNRPFMLCNTGTVLLLVDQTVSLNYGRLRQVAFDGTVTTLTDVPEGISGIAARPDGTLYLSYRSEHVIRRRTPAGAITIIAGALGQSGSVNGAGAVARFRFPGATTLDQTGHLLISDEGNYLLRKMTPDGVVSTLAGSDGKSGSADGTGTAATFSGIAAMTLDDSGTIYASGGNNANIRRITPAGVVFTLAGGSSNISNWKDGVGRNASFTKPVGIAFSGDGSLMIADRDAQCIRRMATDLAVTTYAGRPRIAGELNGTGTNAQLMEPDKSVVDTAGNIYFIDRLRIRKATPAGVITTLAGDPYLAGSANGVGPAATFNYPHGLALDKAGNLYVADTGNHLIRKITPSRVVTTLAGRAGESGAVNGVGGAARFELPNDVTLGPDGSLYVTDYNRAVRKVTTSGVVTTYAGILGDYGTNDGPIASARFLYLSASAFDAQGNLYVLDAGAHNIRKVLADRSQVSTVCGLAGQAGYADGNGLAVRWNQPNALAVAPDGMIYVTDTNRVVRRVTPTGDVTSVGGSAVETMEWLSDGVGGEARFRSLLGISVSADGSIYLSDANNARFVKGTVLNPPKLTAIPKEVTFPEDTSNALVLEATGTGVGAVSFAVVSPPAHGSLTGTAPNLLYTPAADYVGTDLFTFKAVSGFTESAPASVTLTVLPVNDPPAAIAQVLRTPEDTDLPVVLTGTDVEGDPLNYEVTVTPAHGTLSGTAPNLVYTPAADYFGPDSFSFIAKDATLSSTPEQIILTVLPVNDAPTVIEPLPTVLQTRPGLTFAVPLTPRFRDVETASDLLAFSLQAESGETFFASNLQGGTLTLTGTTAGITRLTLQASDPEGLFASSVFSYRVKHLPELAGGALGGIPTQRAILEKPPVRIDLAAWFSDADGDPLTFSLVANSNDVAASAVLTDATLTLTGLTPGTTHITVRATDSDGGPLDHSFDVVAGTEFPTATATGTPAIDPQSGLLLRKVSVVNTTGLVQNGFRLQVAGLPAGTTLYNATVSPSSSGSRIDWTASMEPGAQVELTLAFYSPARARTFTPILSVENALTAAAPPGDGKGMAVRRIVPLKDGSILLEFDSISGHWYQVEYSSDFTTWTTSPTYIHTGANRTQWIDRGPPGTDAPPSAAPTRMYRIKDVTPASS